MPVQDSAAFGGGQGRATGLRAFERPKPVAVGRLCPVFPLGVTRVPRPL